MSEQNQNEQDATPAELTDTNLENVAGGVYIIDGGCIKPPIGCWPPIPIETVSL